MAGADPDHDDADADDGAAEPATAADAEPDAAPTVALDTSALMAPVEAIVRPLAELDRLREGAGEEATAASVGADLARRGERIETEASYADDALVELAAAGRVDYVVTNDGPLQDRVLARDVPVIGLRGRNTLAITEP